MSPGDALIEDPMSEFAPSHVVVRRLGTVDYDTTWARMRRFTDARSADTADEFWVLQHFPVYTQGISCIAQPRDGGGRIRVVATDRGGQITYHAPGQLVVYVLLDLKRRGVGVRRLVQVLEQALISLLRTYGIRGERRAGAPGVYVNDAKVAALGLRIRRGATYHGLSLNVDMDLRPFADIDPCGHEGLAVTQLRELGVTVGIDIVAGQLISELASALNYQDVEFTDF